jgi:hypothetical protein
LHRRLDASWVLRHGKCFLAKQPGRIEENTMSEQPRVQAPEKPSEIPTEISDLAQAIGQLPRELRAAVDPLLARVIEVTKRRRRILNLVQDALGQLRLDMKYLVFDLEATRRERDDYRRQIEQP